MRISNVIGGAVALGVASLASAPSAQALILWGNNAGSTVVIEAFDPVTGAVVHQFTKQAGNGRGVVTVGNTVYYTVVGDGNLYTINATTGVSLGSIPTGQTSLSTIAYDGTNFWLGDYSGTNQAYHFNLGTGLVDKTITLSNCSGFCDGLEYFVSGGQGRLISNRGDTQGPYDVYDLDGILLTSALITPAGSATGIAFDGTDFFVSDIFANSVSVYNTSGTLIRTTTLGAPSPNSGFGRLLEDLSFDYNAVIPTPEPASLALLGTGLLGLGLVRRRMSR